jgi:hypothetical protein
MEGPPERIMLSLHKPSPIATACFKIETTLNPYPKGRIFQRTSDLGTLESVPEAAKNQNQLNNQILRY